MRYIIVAGLAIIGAALGAGLGIMFDPPGWLLCGFSAIGGCIGIRGARGLLWLITPKSKTRLPRHAGDQESLPRPFDERIGRYVSPLASRRECNDAPYESQMPFWSFRDSYSKTPQKSLALIRRVLYRIRAILSGVTPR